MTIKEIEDVYPVGVVMAKLGEQSTENARLESEIKKGLAKLSFEVTI